MPNFMPPLLRLCGGLALAVTAGAPALYCYDQLSESGLRTALVVAMIVWFTTAVIRQRHQTD